MVDAARCDATISKDPAVNGGAHVGALGELARAQATGSPPASSPTASVRARATMPPGVRRRVLERDQYRCWIPGCRHTLDLEVHHLVPRADGGTHDPRYLVTLCGAHHRAVHAGRLLLSGTAHTPRVCHADGSRYGGQVTPGAASNADIGEKVFRGLRWLGYKETEAKRALALAFAEHEQGEAGAAEPWTTEALLKRTLVLLGT